MSLRIDQDHSRFRNIVRGRIRENLRRYISKGELMGRQGKDLVSIPVPQIDIPKLRFGDKQQGGVAQGDGEPGDALSGNAEEGTGQGKAGDQEGQHALEVEVTLDELADILGEELELPNIENKGKSSIVDKKDRYVGIRTAGPNSLRHFKRTFRNALRRQISLGTYDPERPVIIPTRDDFRFKSWKTEEEPVTNAVILYMMDVSGSMGDEQKEIVRIESFWIDTWLRRQYKGIETRFIIHDAAAREVDRDTFFRTPVNPDVSQDSHHPRLLHIVAGCRRTPANPYSTNHYQGFCGQRFLLAFNAELVHRVLGQLCRVLRHSR